MVGTEMKRNTKFSVDCVECEEPQRSQEGCGPGKAIGFGDWEDLRIFQKKGGGWRRGALGLASFLVVWS